MAAKIIRIPEFRQRDVDVPADSFRPEGPAAGWDPYEVWRTRVLQPRLDETRHEAALEERSSKRSFFDIFRRKKTD